jgi:hypothetical protein
MRVVPAIAPRRKNLQFDPVEVKVREATSNDINETPAALLADLARASEDPCVPAAELAARRRRADMRGILGCSAQYPKLWNMLFKRLTDYEQFMHVQKVTAAAPLCVYRTGD